MIGQVNFGEIHWEKDNAQGGPDKDHKQHYRLVTAPFMAIPENHKELDINGEEQDRKEGQKDGSEKHFHLGWQCRFKARIDEAGRTGRCGGWNTNWYYCHTDLSKEGHQYSDTGPFSAFRQFFLGFYPYCDVENCGKISANNPLYFDWDISF